MTIKSSAVCLREGGTVERVGKEREGAEVIGKFLYENINVQLYTHTCSLSLSLILSVFLRLTLRWRERSYVRPSLVTCHSLSRSGRGRTLVSGPEGRMCAG